MILQYLSVAIRACNKYSLAINGTTWAAIKKFYPDLSEKMLVRGAVFARMSPDQKQLLIQELQALGYYVGEYICSSLFFVLMDLGRLLIDNVIELEFLAGL